MPDRDEPFAECPSCGTTFYRGTDAWKTLCLPCWKMTRTPRHPHHDAQPEPVIPGDMLARLIRLCHPDKHSGSAIATEATAWLLTLRKP